MEEYSITELTLKEYGRTQDIKKALRLCKKHGTELFPLFKKKCRELKRQFSEKYLSIHILYKSDKIYYPAVGYAYLCGEKADETIKEIARRAPLFAAETDMGSRLYYAALLKELTAKEHTAKEIKRLLDKFISSKEINSELLCSLSPAAELLKSSEEFGICTKTTKQNYRKKLSMTAKAAKVDEQRLAMRYLSEKDLCRRISEDYANVFPLPSVKHYLLRIFLLPLAFSAAMCFVVGTPSALLLYLPFYSAVKFVLDRLLFAMLCRRRFPPAAVDFGDKIPKRARTLCVISTLLTSEEDVSDSIERAKSFLDKNRTDNLEVCLLCDLPESKEKRLSSDSDMINACRRYAQSPEKNIFIMLRERTYSERAKKWRGRERKRGAICDLVDHLYGEKTEGVFFYGGEPQKPKYMLLLDYDTVCPISGAVHLVSIAAAAENRPEIKNGRVESGYAVICPESVNSLYSTMKSGFSKLMGGDGGAEPAAYRFGGDFYYGVFAEGIFGGKGLIDVEAFRECCMKLPDGRILSHDIIEGSLLRCICADVQFTESFPADSTGYYKRLMRWQRGDLQNIIFLIGRKNKDIIKLPLDRFKLIDNILRILLPINIFLCLFTANDIIAAAALFVLILPFLPLLFAKGKYLSGTPSAKTKGAYRIVCELIMLPKNAVSAACALVITVYKALSGGDMLTWVTAYQNAKTKNGTLRTVSGFLLPTAVCILLTALSVSSAVCFSAGMLMLSSIPVFIVLDKKCREKIPFSLTEKQRKELIEAAWTEYNYYKTYVTREDNFLPPDNVQLSPVFAVAHRTSPTNIGMYLLSLLSVYEMGKIDKDEYERRTLDTLGTVMRLEKKDGNLYNWYDTVTLKPLDRFVSSVDSGNFVCCLTAVRAAAKDKLPDVFDISDRLCGGTDLSLFYNKKNGLLAIGYDDEKGELTQSCYDLYMSEARMTSYYGVSRGTLPVSHYSALSRIKGKCRGYSGCLSWSGTAFEYFMPQLLMPCPGAGLLYEALSYSAYCQKMLMSDGIYGISESGFYAFDKELNYQYRAFGAGCASMRPDYRFEPVFSPYSLFLMLPFDFISAYNALARIKADGIYDEKFGYYEAVDCSEERTKGREIVKSFMAHHKGMSIAAVCNTVCNNKLVEYFMSDKDMKRGEGLTEERITSGDMLYKNIRPKAKTSDAPSFRQSAQSGFLRGGRVSAFMLPTESAKSKAAVIELYDGEYLFYPPVFGQFNDIHPYESFSACVIENGKRYEIREHLTVNRVWGVYESEYDGLLLGEKITVSESTAAFIHEFTVKNKEEKEKNLSLDIFMRPALGRSRDVTAHPAFTDLFIYERYDSENGCISVVRRHRQSGGITAMSIKPSERFFYCLDREQSGGAPLCENISRHIPCPCVRLTVPLILSAGGKRTVKLVIGCGKSETAALNAANGAVSPFIGDKKQCGEANSPDDVIISALMPSLLLKRRNNNKFPAVTGSFAELSQLGIDISKTALLFNCGGTDSCLFAVLRAAGRLTGAGLDFSLILLCSSGYEAVRESVGRSFGFDGSVTVLDRTVLSDRLYRLLCRFAVYAADASSPVTVRENIKNPLCVISSDPPTPLQKTGFCGDSFVIAEKPPTVWSKVIANEVFGVLVSQDSLGFCWAKNSSLGMITPWDNDPTGRNEGIRIYIRMGEKYIDVLKKAVCVYGKNKAEYFSRCGGLSITVGVTVPEKGAALIVRVKAEPTESECDPTNTAQICFCAMLNGEYGPIRGGGMLSASCLSSEALQGKVTLSATGKNVSYCDDIAEFDAGSAAVSGRRSCLAAFADAIGGAAFVISYASRYAESEALINVLADKKRADIIRAPYKLKVKTGDEAFDSFVNNWLPEQIIKGRIYARTGFYQCGGAYGFRDQLQDGMAAVYLDPDILKRLIIRSCTSQFSQGDVLHWYHVTESGKTGVRTRCSDDMLWLPEAVCKYISVTGDTDILNTEAAYCFAPPLGEKREAYLPVEKGEKATVLEHCISALEYAYRTGEHGLLLMGGGDWNDSFDLVGIDGKGESVWLSMFYCMVCDSFCRLPENAVSEETKNVYKKRGEKLRKAINDSAFENGYYLRAFYDDGDKMGAEGNSQCSIDLLTQSFSVLADINGKEEQSRSRSAVNIALARLCDDQAGLIKLFTPPFSDKAENKTGYVSAYPEGIRENGGQYTHAAVWLIMAVRKLGHTDEAYRLFKMLLPLEKDREIFKNEPYYMSADVYTNPQCYARAGWSLYTGAAGWYYRAFLDIIGADIRNGELIFTHKPPQELSGCRICFDGKEYAV